ncbi:hypothetical protein [Bacteroides timonensis]|uniref:hypothetical protein n=1 Tax=Bacteroides timonensis TaxID=1470345 RepID=UPI0004B128C1|nr:hypothetical protein [Bacteroides timonensis]
MMRSEWGSVAQCGFVWKVWNGVWKNSTLGALLRTKTITRLQMGHHYLIEEL